MSIDVFLSVGRTCTPEQERFVSALESALRSSGLTPRTVGRSDFSSKAPLKRIAEVLDDCHGTVVLAFERTHAPLVVDRPGSPDEENVEDVRLPTIWNQIEAAMSYSRALPLLVIVQHGLRDEGLLEARYDWYVHWVELDESALGANEFRAVLADWVSEVTKHQNNELTSHMTTTKSATEMSLRELLGTLTVPQIWGALTAVVAVFVAVATLAFKLGAAG